MPRTDILDHAEFHQRVFDAPASGLSKKFGDTRFGLPPTFALKQAQRASWRHMPCRLCLFLECRFNADWEYRRWNHRMGSRIQ
jgi:hypothetical protein